jgi:hypothetical protein
MKCGADGGEGHNEMPHYFPQTDANRNIGQDQYRHYKQMMS